ncbi:MAG: hypothetical protein ACRCW6_03115, partial [Mycoplasmoidaceae bacterium]
MKILWIVPNLDFENKINDILTSNKEISFSFNDLITPLADSQELFYNKIHSIFGIRYVDNVGIIKGKLSSDIKNNYSYFLKMKKLNKWIFKFWLKKTGGKQICFYLATPDIYNGLTDLNFILFELKKYFQGFIYTLQSGEEKSDFLKEKKWDFIHNFVIDKNKDLRE